MGRFRPRSATHHRDDPGAIISGTVYDNNNTPFTKFATVYAYIGDPCGNKNFVKFRDVDPSDGTYAVEGLPAGTYYLHTENPDGNYKEEWWASGGSSPNCADAESLTVIEAERLSGKNFNLIPTTTSWWWALAVAGCGSTTAPDGKN
jgi:hypothetical protein